MKHIDDINDIYELRRLQETNEIDYGTDEEDNIPHLLKLDTIRGDISVPEMIYDKICDNDERIFILDDNGIKHKIYIFKGLEYGVLENGRFTLTIKNDDIDNDAIVDILKLIINRLLTKRKIWNQYQKYKEPRYLLIDENIIYNLIDIFNYKLIDKRFSVEKKKAIILLTKYLEISSLPFIKQEILQKTTAEGLRALKNKMVIRKQNEKISEDKLISSKAPKAPKAPEAINLKEEIREEDLPECLEV